MKPVALPQLGSGSNGSFFDVNTILPSPDQLVAAPVAFSVTITPYENAIASLDNKEPLTTPFRLMPLSDYYLALLDEYRLVDSILNTVRQGTNAPNFPFDARLIQVYGGETGLRSLYDDIQFDLAFLEDAISQCYSAKTRSCTIPSAVQGAKANLGSSLTALQKTQDQLTAQLKKKSQDLLALNPASPAPENRVQVANMNADLANLNVYLASVERSISRIQALTALATDDGRLDPKFFQKFYQYVASTPLPRAAYTGPDFSALQSLSFLTAAPGDKEKQLAASNDALRRAALVFRLTPWKHFFCQTLKSSSMCVSEAALQDLVSGTLPGITSADLTPVAPPPPPPPAPRPDPVPPRFSNPHGPCGIGGILC